MLGYCGQDCESCSAFKSPGADENTCAGCRSDSFGASIAGKNCAIRICARTRRLAVCAYCPDFPCSKLQAVFSRCPDAERQLLWISGTPPG